VVVLWEEKDPIMAYLMFVDESGQDHRESPYEVLAGVAIHDSVLWDLICEIKAAEKAIFGTTYAQASRRELKAKKLLHRKTFRHARQGSEMQPTERTELAKAILLDGAAPSRDRLTALGQAKIAFVGNALDMAYRYRVRAFASMVEPSAPRPTSKDFLRKDYSYLFERFYHFVSAEAEHERGIVVFDEVEKSESHILLGQMSEYFLKTVKGRERASRILPEPFFVHSDLMTGIMLADLTAYILSFNVRLPHMTNPRRDELDPLGEKVKRLRPQRVEKGGYWVSAFKYIDDLRTRQDRGLPWPP
jgi:hypothetical protein